MNTKAYREKGSGELKKGFRFLASGCQPLAFRHWCVAVVAVVLTTLPLFAERQPFERYQSVVDRQMFGQPPPGFDPTKPPSEVSAKEERAKEQELTKEQEQLKSAIRFSAINVTPAGDTAVGFTDNSDNKNPKHYYLKVGETRDGWTVKEADALAATMTIAKDEIEVSLTLGGNSANGGTKKAGAASGGPARMPTFSKGVRPNLLGGRGLGSLRERRAMREQQKAADAKAAADEKARIAAEEKEKEERHKAELEAEKAQREADKAEMQKKLSEMADALKRQREESEAKKAADEQKDANDE